MPMRRGRWALAAGVAAGTAGWVATARVRAAMGGRPSGARAQRIARSPQYHDGAFRNPTRTSTMPAPDTGRRAVTELLFGGAKRKPPGPIPVTPLSAPPGPATGAATGAATATGTATTTEPPRAAGRLHITWYGHSSTLVDIEGYRVLFDPVWSERCSPSPAVGPRRLHPVPGPLHLLPRLDAIVISHDHYDHLDMATIQELCARHSAPFVVPLGVGAHLERWDVPPGRIIELDWNEDTTLGPVRLTAVAARHFSGRTTRRDYTLWSSWVLATEHRRVFFAGDTGYFDGYPALAAAHGPFDVTLMPIGAYDPGWPDIHMTPEEAVTAHLELAGGLLVPIHWATFVLAFHPWGEPADRLWREAKARGARIAVPRPGDRIDVDEPAAVDGWWQTLV